MPRHEPESKTTKRNRSYEVKPNTSVKKGLTKKLKSIQEYEVESDDESLREVADDGSSNEEQQNARKRMRPVRAGERFVRVLGKKPIILKALIDSGVQVHVTRHKSMLSQVFKKNVPSPSEKVATKDLNECSTNS